MPRIRLYHIDKPDGEIFTSQEDVEDAISEGWKEAPWLIHEDEKEIAGVDHPEGEQAPHKPKKRGPKPKKIASINDPEGTL